MNSNFMKYLSIIGLLALFIAACSAKKLLTIQTVPEAETADSISYELIVLDPGFDSWFYSQAKSPNFHSQTYYENWNQQYVNAWNYERIGYRHSNVIHGSIDYDSSVDYGLEINHKLFYYFMYVENKLGIRLLANGPKSF
ncbi:DUF6146 family protein [Mangrovibacterium sp.]|uniref:DUF6146 family protein n=1 Tax=Mangrovibacterium sp. TaxID=1961364 RepID=UPI00356911F1